MNFEFTLAPIQKRAAAIVLALVPLVLVLFVALPAFSAYQEHREHVGVLMRSLLAYQSAIANAPAERAAIAQLRKTQSLNDLVFPSQQASLAAAQLQSQVSQIAERGGASVVQSVSKVDAADSGLVELRVHLVLEADIAHLTQVLYGIEQARPILMIRRCLIRDPDGEWQGRDAQTGPNRLQAEFDISAFMRPS